MTLEKNMQEKKSERKAYTSPELTVYGNVADLTKSGGSGGVDSMLASGAE